MFAKQKIPCVSTAADAEINGPKYDRHEESWPSRHGSSASAPRRVIISVILWEIRMIPNWNRASSRLPDFLQAFNHAVQLDNR